MEGGRRAGMIIVLGMGYLLSHIPMQGKEEKGRPSQATFPIPTSSFGGNKEEPVRMNFDCKFR
jgi:hypothetical protein